MHSLVRRYIKTAVAFLIVGLLLGGWMLVRRELSGAFAGAYEVSAHTHAILVGFVMMMILGVALWLFPRPDKADIRYRPALAEAAYWMLTVGTAGRVVGELARPYSAAAWLRWRETERERWPHDTDMVRMFAELQAQVARVERALEAQGTDLERLGEAQRYAARLLAERGPADTSAGSTARVSGRVVTPH